MPGAPEPGTYRPSPAPTAVSWPLPLSTTLYRWRCTDDKARRLRQKTRGLPERPVNAGAGPPRDLPGGKGRR